MSKEHNVLFVERAYNSARRVIEGATQLYEHDLPPFVAQYAEDAVDALIDAIEAIERAESQRLAGEVAT